MRITPLGEGIAKVHYQSDQEELLRACGGQMAQLLGDGGVKSAASELFSRAELEKHRPDKDHFALHIVIMGDSDTYGGNKNGDIWPKQACVNYHPTFVSHGAMFREHRNRSQEKEGIGLIKASGFGDLRRIELILHGNIKKAAEEYEMAREGKSLSFSMSARVPYDECNCCHNRAKRASTYCDHLRYSMNQYLPEFQKFAGAINDHPTFFDASRVRNPADRIAHYLEYRFHDDLEKAASFDRVISGAEWAEYEGVCLPCAIAAFSLEKQATLHRLAAEEAWLDTATGNDAKRAFVTTAVPHALRHQFSDADLEALRALRPGTVFRELAKRACVLPFFSFAAYAQGTRVTEATEDPVVKAAARYLPTAFRDLVKAGSSDLESLFAADSDYSAGCDSALTGLVAGIFKTAEAHCSLEAGRLRERILQSAAAHRIPAGSSTTGSTKLAATVDSRARVLAESYAHYQLNALSDISQLTGSPSNEYDLLAVSANRCVYP